MPPSATAARAMIEATNALLPYSLSPQQLGDPADVRRRVSVIADMLVRGPARNNTFEDYRCPRCFEQLSPAS